MKEVKHMVYGVSLQSSVIKAAYYQIPRVSASKNSAVISFGGGKAVKPILIMIVDDEAVVMNLLSMYITNVFKGFCYHATILKYGSPDMALKYMRDGKTPDYFFIDKKMPHDNDGAKLVVTLLAKHKIPIESIIYQSGEGVDEKDLSFVLHKPYKIQELRDELILRLPKK